MFTNFTPIVCSESNLEYLDDLTNVVYIPFNIVNGLIETPAK